MSDTKTDADFLKDVGMDGHKWAKGFMELFGTRLGEVDEALMIAWFCNSIMAGYDEGRCRLRKEIQETIEVMA